MLDPTLPIQSALYQAISTANVTLDGAPVPVYAYVPTAATAPYILLNQVSCVPGTGARACAYWECVYQLTVVTSFTNTPSDLPSLQVQGQLFDLLHEQPLALSGGFAMSTLRVDLTTKSSSYDQNTQFVMRYIRLKMRVHRDK